MLWPHRWKWKPILSQMHGWRHHCIEGDRCRLSCTIWGSSLCFMFHSIDILNNYMETSLDNHAVRTVFLVNFKSKSKKHAQESKAVLRNARRRLGLRMHTLNFGFQTSSPVHRTWKRLILNVLRHRFNLSLCNGSKKIMNGFIIHSSCLRVSSTWTTIPSMDRI